MLDGEEPLIAPDLLVAEVAKATCKLVRAGEISEEHGLRIAAAVPSAFANLVGSSRLSSRAFDIAMELDYPIYDCLYLTLAELERTRMVTADDRLLDRVVGTEWAEHVRPLAG